MPRGVYNHKGMRIGCKHSEATKAKIGMSNKGKVHSIEFRMNISKRQMGQKRHTTPHTQESKDKISKTKLENAVYGEKHHRWIQDRNSLKRFGDDYKDRRSYAYNNWRKEVWTRDNFRCKISNKDCSGKLQAHHILAWREYPELRFDINNGIALCQFHHPRKWEEEKRLSPYFKSLVSVSKEKSG